jgi:hypothetical protein
MVGKVFLGRTRSHITTTLIGIPIGGSARPGYGRRAELLIFACRGIHGPADDYAKLQCPLFGYLLTCATAGAWPGSVEVTGGTLSHSAAHL